MGWNVVNITNLWIYPVTAVLKLKLSFPNHRNWDWDGLWIIVVIFSLFPLSTEAISA